MRVNRLLEGVPQVGQSAVRFASIHDSFEECCLVF